MHRRRSVGMWLLRITPVILVALPALAMASPSTSARRQPPVIAETVLASYGSPVSPAVERIEALTMAAREDSTEDPAERAAWDEKMIRPCVRSGSRETC